MDHPLDLASDQVDAYRAAVQAGSIAQMRIAATVGSEAKFSSLQLIIEEARRTGRKVLVFSEYREVLDASEKVLGSASCRKIDGRTSVADVERVEDEFKSDASAVALVYQIRIGGVGKNFQHASVVVLMEPQFAPASEWQAVARARRMGQTDHVVCHRLISVGTVDEHLVSLTSFKAELVNELAHDSVLAKEITDNDRPIAGDNEVVRFERDRLAAAS